MVENSKFVTIPSFPDEKDGLSKNIISIVKFLKEPKSLQEILYPSSNNEVIVQKTSNTENLAVKKMIYVCSFCQVFSSSESAIVTHITSTHKASLPSGTRAEDFVSQLQALQNENDKKRKNKGGRPKKKDSSTVIKEKAVISEPVLGPDGLYWCQTCHRRFKKPRQLSRHVCLEITAENDLSSESASDSDSTCNFQTYMDIEPTPWLRRPKHSNKSSEVKSQNFIQSPNDETLDELDLLKPGNLPNKMNIHWRDDPNYVQLFENDTERFAFEEHLKSIDYSCFDNLFVKIQNKQGKCLLKRKNFKKRNKSSKIALYTCIICRKEFHSLFHIRMHCLTHTDAKPFICPKCPYRSNTKGSLYTHMRNHTGKLFHCSKCAFKTVKRSHLLEHEQTHSSVMQLCKLCKNTYKTVKSLIAHVHRYHNNPGGKKYAKFLSGKSSKDSFIKCNICQKKFKTQTSFSTHTHTVAPTHTATEHSHENIQDASLEVNQEQLPSIPENNTEYTNEMQTLNVPLVLDDLLQQKNSEIYRNVFQQCSNPHVQTQSESLSNTFIMQSSSGELSHLDVNNQFQTPNTVLEECEKTLGIDLINECLRDSSFADQVMAETCGQSPKVANSSDSYGLQEIQMTYPSQSIITPNITESGNLSKSLSHLDSELNNKNDPTDFVSLDPKSAEIKLFEKCRRAPAYVCCVCSAIYICPISLKAHLKEHVNTNNSPIEQDDDDLEHAEISEADATIDSVCKMLEDSDDERELEKLYISSLDMMYYLPEVSVLLENDPKFNDSVLDDFSNLPMSDESEFTSQM